jgi:hypothetical protein
MKAHWLRVFRWVACLVALSACGDGGHDGQVTSPGGAVSAPPPTAEGAGFTDPAAAGDSAMAMAMASASDGAEGTAQAGMVADAGSDAAVAGGDLDAGTPRDASSTPEPFFGEATFSVVTKPTGHSRYEPDNVLAIWVEDADGTPIKILLRYVGVFGALQELRGRVVPALNDGGVTFFVSPTMDPDTITSATYRVHDRREVTWNMTDHRGAPVPDGRYTIVVEAADDRQGSNLTSLSFDKGNAPVSIEVPETEQFGALTLDYTPPP